jgi:hypothetical protein
MSQPITYRGKTITIDFAAVRQAVRNCTLSKRDRWFIDQTFPGTCAGFECGATTTVQIGRLKLSIPSETIGPDRP